MLLLTYVAATGQLVRDLWPSELPKLAAVADDSVSPGSGDRVPCSIEGMMEWAYVGKNYGARDKTRRHALLYIMRDVDPLHAPRVRVSIRLQGFVERLDLRVLGNWTG